MLARLIEQMLQNIILGIIQGISEWLPISSTAHLKIVGTFFGFTVTPLFNIILHLGTLAVLLFFFREDIKNILIALVHLDFKSENGKLIPLIIIASIPTALISFAYITFLQDTAGTMVIIAVTFLIGATFVYTTKFAKEKAEDLSYKTALLMGAAQGFAIFPGLSRSGVTISSGLLLGQKRKKAFKFSFLLSIPAIIGDFILEAYTDREALAAIGLNEVNIILGLIAAFIVGYFSLKIVSKVVQGKKFHYFAFYTWPLGIVLLIWSFLVH